MNGEMIEPLLDWQTIVNIVFFIIKDPILGSNRYRGGPLIAHEEITLEGTVAPAAITAA